MGDPLFDNPFYTHPCTEVTEDHARHVILHQYTCCIKIVNTWAIPNTASMAWLDVPAIVDMLVGSCLWNKEYGTFRITAFDKGAQRVQIQTKVGTAGNTVPECTKFIIIADV